MIQQILCLKCIEPNAEDGISESLVSLSRDVCLFFLSFFFLFFYMCSVLRDWGAEELYWRPWLELVLFGVHRS